MLEPQICGPSLFANCMSLSTKSLFWRLEELTGKQQLGRHPLEQSTFGKGSLPRRTVSYQRVSFPTTRQRQRQPTAVRDIDTSDRSVYGTESLCLLRIVVCEHVAA